MLVPLGSLIASYEAQLENMTSRGLAGSLNHPRLKEQTMTDDQPYFAEDAESEISYPDGDCDRNEPDDFDTNIDDSEDY
jgi:hypothetical protein